MKGAGRPVIYTNETDRLVTISLRIPPELYAAVQACLDRAPRQAKLSATRLAIEGLQWRLSQEKTDSNTVSIPLSEPWYALDDGIPYDDEVSFTPRAAPGPQAPEPTRPIECPRPMTPDKEPLEKGRKPLPTHTPLAPFLHEKAAPDPDATSATFSDPDPATAPSSEILAKEVHRLAVPSFDPVKHRLGALCKNGHDWEGTGQSLRAKNKAGYCLACNADINREKRQRQAAPQAP